MTTTASTSNLPDRWVQLLAGIVCTVMVANLQYAWTYFVDPIDAQHHWGREAIQWGFTIFVAAATWLVAYAYTTSAKIVADVSRDVRSGMISINHHGLALPELPFGAIQDSGYGSEGGTEAMEGYLNTKLVTVANAT